MESNPRCPACLSTATAETLTVREMMFGLDAAFPYARCPDCGTLRLLEVPDNYGPYYPTDYYSVDLDPERVLGRRPIRDVVGTVGASTLFGSGRVAGAADAVIAKRQFRTLLSLLRSVRLAGLPAGQATRVLDVGCGSGMLVFALGLAGMTDVTGIDPFGPPDHTLSTGAEILHRGLDDVGGSYDLVMFHHSLEHVLDAEQSLRDARALLTPGGRILVRMPTPSSTAFQTYGADWVQLDAPRHVTLPSRAGFEALAQRAGLQIEAVEDDSTAFQFWGSEQARAGVAMNDDRSQFVNPKLSAFSARQMRAWEKAARQFNVEHRGDQAAWVLSAVD